MSFARSARRAPSSWVRSLIRRLHPYVPGEQPRIPGLVKLNTNENPYPPSPKVLAAVQAATDARLRLYPNPTAQPLRNRLARLHGCHPGHIMIGNGSDELLALAARAFVGTGRCARPGQDRSARAGPCVSRSTIQYFVPSYSLYPVLAAMQGALPTAVPLKTDFGLPSVAELRRGTRWDFRAALTYITTPNAPSGRGYDRTELGALCAAQRGVVVLDEAYVDFAREDALALTFQHPHVLVFRTFSKAYSLCFQRVGYAVGHPELIAALDQIRDSYNVNGLGQIAALATLQHLPYYRRNFQRIIATRERVSRALEQSGFSVFPSQTNFLLVRPPCFPAEDWFTRLRHRKILVRWFAAPDTCEYLRVTIGTDEDMDRLLAAVRSILR